MKQKRSNLNNGGRSRIIILLLALISIIGLIVIVSALTTEEQNALQDELNPLENELGNSGYDWLVNYSIYNSIYQINKIGEIK